MFQKMYRFLLSEDGELIEWLVGAFILGVGAIPIVLGIADAIIQKTSEGEDKIRTMIWSP